ncbi:MAG TPA: proton-conducting transporter membrane subunit, partial [Burkholderiaceae bacterium]|nr:proton-conducting transporter membrane subunit [Burkholderiaceae bacterium]
MAALPILLSIPFVAAALIGVTFPWLAAQTPLAQRRNASLIAGAAAVLATATLLTQASAVFAGESVIFRIAWLPALGVDFTLRLDGLAFLFALLISAIGCLIVLYARYYMSEQDPNPKFFALLLCFMGAMLGVALAGDLIVLVLFWELTSLSSFLLIGYWNHRADARQGARMALTITGAGGLALLAGVLMLGSIVGSYDLETVLASGDLVRAHPDYFLCLVLILAGAFTKSAQFPFHFWLPHAMAAPTPVSAYLHSATMVKAGIFLLARLYPTLAGTPEWFYIVTAVGGATLLVGAFHAIFQHDLKGLLAYSTVSHLGLITMLLGLSTQLAAVAAVFHILNHATFKASLFMAAGIIDHETGSRDMRRLAGLWKYMRHTAILAIIAAAAMAGVPLLNGFLSKEMFFAETLALQHEIHWAFRFGVPVVATLAGLLSVAYSLRFVHDVFFNGEPKNLPHKPHEPPRWMRVPVELLVVLCVLVGLVPAVLVGPLLAVGARAVLGTELPYYSLTIWHGLNLPLAMSGIALAGGVVLYRWLMRERNLHLLEPGAGAGKAAFERAVAALLAATAALTHWLQDGGLRRILVLLLATAVLAGAWPLAVTTQLE